ncbi:MAG: hypothetical protein M1820_003995 [Bogoriella megaspora]|nr:MAG: hypothetical protein M1820_003995 [Bogoriella megaspora]
MSIYKLPDELLIEIVKLAKTADKSGLEATADHSPYCGPECPPSQTITSKRMLLFRNLTLVSKRMYSITTPLMYESFGIGKPISGWLFVRSLLENVTLKSFVRDIFVFLRDPADREKDEHSTFLQEEEAIRDYQEQVQMFYGRELFTKITSESGCSVLAWLLALGPRLKCLILEGFSTKQSDIIFDLLRLLPSWGSPAGPVQAFLRLKDLSLTLTEKYRSHIHTVFLLPSLQSLYLGGDPFLCKANTVLPREGISNITDFEIGGANICPITLASFIKACKVLKSFSLAIKDYGDVEELAEISRMLQMDYYRIIGDALSAHQHSLRTLNISNGMLSGVGLFKGPRYGLGRLRQFTELKKIDAPLLSLVGWGIGGEPSLFEVLPSSLTSLTIGDLEVPLWQQNLIPYLLQLRKYNLWRVPHLRRIVNVSHQRIRKAEQLERPFRKLNIKWVNRILFPPPHSITDNDDISIGRVSDED